MSRKLPTGTGHGERRHLAILAATLALLAVSTTTAQAPCIATVRTVVAESPRLRLKEVARESNAHRNLVADGVECSADSTALVRRSFRIRNQAITAALFWPEVRASDLGGVPDARGDGVMWYGRGANLYGTSAISLDGVRAHILFAPAIWWSENRRFDFFPGRDPNRSPFASPWYYGLYSLDYPSRFGTSPVIAYELGESAAWASWHNIDGGISTSTQALGPGIRSHLLLGPDAPGMPRFFIRTAQPMRSRLGIVSGTAFLGTLTESRFFDTDPRNDTRKLWAWSAAFSRTDSSAVSAGVAQGLLRPTTWNGPTEQMITTFLQVRSPADAARVWLEVGRMGALPSLRRVLTVPTAGLAYVIGFEQASRFNAGALLVSAEAANLEQPVAIVGELPHDFYTSSRISQGWSQRGRPLGAATGPGSQSQWLAFDWIATKWSAGLFGERVRWNEDALLREYLAFPNRHDVSLRLGLKAGWIIGPYEAALQLSSGKRLNYLFQNGTYIPAFRTVDVSIPQLRLSLVPIHR